MRYWTILIFVLLFSCRNDSLKDNPTIPTQFKFSEKHLLEWSDFKGSPVPDSISIAVTNSGIQYFCEDKSIRDTLVLQFNIYSFFDRHKSWKRNDQVNDTVLRHEEFHYLISELNARALRAQLKAYTFTENYKLEMQELFDKAIANLDSMQVIYDEATEHGNNLKNQKLLEDYILSQLVETNVYSVETFQVYTNVPMTYSDVMSNKVNRSF